MFKKAERKQIKLKLAITGPTGSGKTFSALRLAKGIGGKMAVIDTENGSASLYSEKFDFDVLDLTPPFTTEKYIAAINAAEKAGYEVIVIDSLTHAWAGEGGLLEQKAELDKRPGSNHWTNWGPIEKKDAALKNAYLHSNCHIVATMRSKMDYTQSEKDGKKKIEKLGMAPIARDGLTYEFTIVFDAGMDHKVETSKDRTGLFTDRVFQITEETGEEIKKWIDSGAVIKPDPKPAPVTSVTNQPQQHVKPQTQSTGHIQPGPSATTNVSHSEEPLFDLDDIIDADVSPGPVNEYVIDTGGPNLIGKKLTDLTQEQLSNIVAHLIRKQNLTEKEKTLLFQVKRKLGI